MLFRSIWCVIPDVNNPIYETLGATGSAGNCCMPHGFAVSAMNGFPLGNYNLRGFPCNLPYWEVFS